MGSKVLKRLKRKPILALVVGAVVFSSAFAFAATLTVNTGTLGAGNRAVTSCASSLTAAYTVAWDATAKDFKVSGITVKGDTTGCAAGNNLAVELTDSTGLSLGEVSKALVAGDINASASIAFTPGSTILAKNVSGVDAVVSS